MAAVPRYLDKAAATRLDALAPTRPFTRGESTATAFWIPAAIALVFALGLVFYIGGYARVTAASYQRMQLRGIEKQVTAENDALRADVERLRGRDAVTAWATTNGMVPAASPSAVVCGMASTEGR